MHNIDSSSIWPVINQGLVTLAGGVVTFAAGWTAVLMQRYLPKFIPAQLESKASGDLNTALQNGVAIGMAKLQVWESVHSDVNVRGVVQAFAVQYAVDHAPDAIARFGLSPEQLALKALAYLPMPKTAVGTTGATVTSVPVAVADLPRAK